MKYLLILIFFILENGLCKGQVLYTCPFKNGVIYKHDEKANERASNPSSVVKVYGQDSLIYSIASGVIAMITFSNDKATVILKTRDRYIAYSPFDSVLIHIDDKIEEGELIGVSKQKEVDILLTADTSSASVLRNAEKCLKCRVVVRLDIPKDIQTN